jgi:hypothetical protein
VHHSQHLADEQWLNRNATGTSPLGSVIASDLGMGKGAEFDRSKASFRGSSCFRVHELPVPLTCTCQVLTLQKDIHLGCCLAAATAAASEIFMRLCTNNIELLFALAW